MNRTQKMAVLTHVLQGNSAKLQAIRQAKDEETIIFIVDKAPEGWYQNPDDERPVKVNYELGDKDITEYLTKAQMWVKTKGVIIILPHNGRSGSLVKKFLDCPPPNEK